MNFLIRAAAIAAMLHITPIVVLVKRSDAVQALLPGADAYVAREVHLSGTDAHRLHETVDWSPEDGVLVVVAAGLTDHYRGLRPGGAPGGAAGIAGRAGNLAVYVAGEVDKGVARALAAYGAFYNHVRP